jgi:hypothetical protein
MLRALHRPNMRMFGAGHSNTLMTAGNLAESLSPHGKFAEAQELSRSVLDDMKRAFGTITKGEQSSCYNLVATLFSQCKYPEAEQILLDVLVWCQRSRAFGTAHPSTLQTAHNLKHVQERMHA